MRQDVAEALVSRLEDVARQALGFLIVEVALDDDGDVQMFCCRAVVEQVGDPFTEVALASLDPDEGWGLGDERMDLMFVPVCEVAVPDDALDAWFSALRDAVLTGSELELALTRTLIDQALGAGRPEEVVGLLVHRDHEVVKAALCELHALVAQALGTMTAESVRGAVLAAWAREPTTQRAHAKVIRSEGLSLFRSLLR